MTEGKIKITVDGAQKGASDVEKLEKGVAKLDGTATRAAGGVGRLNTASVALGTAAGNLASGAMQAVVTAATDWARAIPEGAAAAERHEAALRSLGSAYSDVSQATRGNVTAEQALQVQQRLTQSGLALNGQQLAAVTQRAREFARATGGDLNQAIEQLSEGLRSGSGEALRAFGVNVREGQTRTASFVQAIGQLETQMRATTPATMSLAETHQQLSTALGESNQQLQAMVAQQLGLHDFFAQMTSWLRDVNDGTRQWSDAIGGTARELVGLGQAGPALNQSRSGAFVEQYGQRLAELRRLGVDVSRYPMAGQIGAAGTDADHARALAILDRDLAVRRSAPRAGSAAALFDRSSEGATAIFGGGGSVGGSVDTAAELGGIASAAQTREADATRRRESERQAAERERRRRLREQAARERGPDYDLASARDAYSQAIQSARSAGAANDLGLTWVRPPADLESQRLNSLRRAAQDTSGRTGESESARLGRITAAIREYTQVLGERHERERVLTESVNASAQADIDAEKALRTRLQTAATDALTERQGGLGQAHDRITLAHDEAVAQRDLGRAERERTEGLTSLRNATSELLRDTDARIEAARAEGASQEQLNSLLQMRLGLQRTQLQVNAELRASEQERTAQTRAFRDEMVGALGQTADAFGSAAAAAIDGEESFGRALQGMLRQQLLALTKQAVVEALKNSAIGLGMLAVGNFPGAGNAFAAAGLWAAVGVAAGVGAAAIPKVDKSAGGGAGARPQAASVPGAGAREREPSGPLAINISVNGALFNEGVEESIVRGLDRAHSRGLTPRYLQRGGGGA